MSIIEPFQVRNRDIRRRLEAMLHRPDTTCLLCTAADRVVLVRIVAALAAADDALTGFTADALRRGGGHG
jgi:hypothetical protein